MKPVHHFPWKKLAYANELRLVIVLALIAVPGCRRQPPSLTSVVEVATAETRASSTTDEPISTVSGLAVESRSDIRDELALVDPTRDGWGTEAFNDRAQQLLASLGRWLADGLQQDTAAPVAIADQSSFTRLRPRQLEAVYDDAGLRVLRWERGNADDNGEPVSFVDACKSLCSAMKKTSELSAEFKIVRVELSDQLSDQVATTEVHCHLNASDDTRRIQQNAVWQCEWQVRGQDIALASVKLVEFEEVVADEPLARFADYTSSVIGDEPTFQQQLAFGIDHWRDRLDWRFGWDIVGSHGLAVADVNGDDLEDVLVCEAGGLPNRLLLHQTDGTVKDASAASGLDYIEPTHSALFIDLDNDGDQDCVLALSRFVFFLSNNGHGSFTRESIHQTRSLLRSMVAADYDNDGLLDIYLCGYASRDIHSQSIGLGRPMPYHDANNGAPNFLLANRGEFRFEDVTDDVGLNVNNQRFSYAAAWEDYDNDGDLDLYVANDFGRNNLYRNDEGRFNDVAALAGVEDMAAGMSASWGDYNRDGLVDLYVGNMFSSAGNRIAYQRKFKSGDDDGTRAQYQRHARGNSLFLNLGDGTFQDVSLPAGVTVAKWAWSSRFVDVNNDGWEDIVVANGMITGTAGPGDL